MMELSTEDNRPACSCHTEKDVPENQARYVRYPSRPPKHDWLSLKPEISRLIEEGWGFSRLAKKYGMSTGGMRSVVLRLNLQTRWQVPLN